MKPHASSLSGHFPIPLHDPLFSHSSWNTGNLSICLHIPVIFPMSLHNIVFRYFLLPRFWSICLFRLFSQRLHVVLPCNWPFHAAITLQLNLWIKRIRPTSSIFNGSLCIGLRWCFVSLSNCFPCTRHLVLLTGVQDFDVAFPPTAAVWLGTNWKSADSLRGALWNYQCTSLKWS